MILGEYSHAYVLITSVLFGAFIGVIYSICVFILGIFKCSGVCKRKVFVKIACSLCEIIFFILITPMTAIFLYGINMGIVRWYIIVSILGGFLFYRITIGVLIKKLTDKISSFINKILFKILNVVCKQLAKTKTIIKVIKKRHKKNKKKLIYAIGKENKIKQG